jgi:hypothetical protein
VVTFKQCISVKAEVVVNNNCGFKFFITEKVNIEGKAGCLNIKIPSTKCEFTVGGSQSGLTGVGYKNSGTNLENKIAIKGIKIESPEPKVCGFSNKEEAITASWTGIAITKGTNVE